MPVVRLLGLTVTLPLVLSVKMPGLPSGKLTVPTPAGALNKLTSKSAWSLHTGPLKPTNSASNKAGAEPLTKPVQPVASVINNPILSTPASKIIVTLPGSVVVEASIVPPLTL